MTIATTNPATGETVKTFDADSDELIGRKLQKAHDAFQASSCDRPGHTG